MTPSRSNSAELDDTDRAILQLLEGDARCPNAHIARGLGISESTVKKRIDKMFAMGSVQILAIVRPESMGYLAHVLVSIKVRPGELERVTQELIRLPEIVYISYTSGPYSIRIEVLLEGPSDVPCFVSNKLGRVEGIVETDVTYVLQTPVLYRIRRNGPDCTKDANPTLKH